MVCKYVLKKVEREIIRIRKSMHDRQHNGQNKDDKRRHNGRQSNTQTTKDCTSRTVLKPGMNADDHDKLVTPAVELTLIIMK